MFDDLLEGSRNTSMSGKSAKHYQFKRAKEQKKKVTERIFELIMDVIKVPRGIKVEFSLN